MNTESMTDMQRRSLRQDIAEVLDDDNGYSPAVQTWAAIARDLLRNLDAAEAHIEEDDMHPNTAARFYTLKEAAAILNVNPSTLSRQCQAGEFPHVRIGRTVRIPVAEVERLERGEPMRESLLDVPDYVTATPSMFDDDGTAR